MKGAEFLRKVRRLGHTRGVAVRFVAKRGKGSHGTLYYGSAMLGQLGLTLDDLR